MAGYDSMLSPPVDLLDYYSDSVAGIGMDLDFNTAINAQVTRDLTGRTLPGYATPGLTTSAVATAIQPDKEISVTDITNDFGGGGDADGGDTSGESFGGGDAHAW